MTIIIDTREQRPWSFPANVRTEIGTLSTGDYALKGDPAFAIERKSGEDFAGTISTGWARFCRELNRMDEKHFPAKIIIVESDFRDFCFREDFRGILPPNHEHVRVTPQFCCKRAAELVLLRGAAVLFAGDAELAAALALSIFRERDEDLLCR